MPQGIKKNLIKYLQKKDCNENFAHMEGATPRSASLLDVNNDFNKKRQIDVTAQTICLMFQKSIVF